MNKAILTGTIGKDVKESNINGMVICSFPLGTSDSVKNKDGKWESQTEWHNIKTFGKLADVVAKFKKGDQVELSGKIKYSTYKNKDGQTIYTTEIIADSVIRKKKAEGNSQPQQRTKSQQEVYTQEDFNPEAHEGDLPF
jgi:single-strand DNA-binding protein